MKRCKLRKAVKDSSKRLMDWAIAHGWKCELTNGNHLRFTHPAIRRVYFGALTAGDSRRAE